MADSTAAICDRRDDACGGACCCRRRAHAQSRQDGLLESLRRHFLRPRIAQQPPRSQRRPGGARSGALALERRGRRLRPSPDDRRARSARRRPISTIASPAMWPDAARRNISQENFQRFTAGLDARSAHHGPDGFAAGIHQVDLGLSRHPGERQPPRQGPRDPRQIQGAVRRDGKGLRRRPLHHRRDLGHRVQLLDADGRPQRAAIDRDARLHRPPPGLFQGRVSLRAGNPQSRRSAARADARLLGRRVRADAIHADRVQALCGRCRRRRPPRRRRRSRRPDRLDRQQSEEGRLAGRPDLGLRGRGAPGLQLHAGRPRQGDDDGAMGAARPQARRPTSPSRIRPRRPICWRPPAPRARAS